MKFFFIFASCLLLAALVPTTTRAETPQKRAVFALVVTSNHTAEMNRPDLRYADDDGVKYGELFRTFEASDVVVHTELDRDTERLHPTEKARLRPPTRAEVLSSAKAMAGRMADAVRRGLAVDFYFVFAGHGDVNHGKGYLALADGRLESDDVEAMLARMPATRSHVILDSCNSFFVLAARKPGGRIVATAADLGASFGKRMPNVGVFLSTNAEAEVYEWSELQAGIFSHAVRSGLAGGADANSDGVVSYDELHAFVEIAAEKVKNPQFRPHVFARGPRGDNREPFVRLGGAHAERLSLDAAADVRLTVKDSEGVPVVDVHKERGAPMTLGLPARWAAGGSVEQIVGTSNPRTIRRYALAAPASDGADERDHVLAMVEVAPNEESSSRGIAESLRALFESPFGPRAFAEFDARPAEQDVYGVDREHLERLRLLLRQAADVERGTRTFKGITALGVSTFATTGAVWALTHDPWEKKFDAYALAGVGVGAGVVGFYQLLWSSRAERAYHEYGLALADDAASGEARALRERLAFARAEQELFAAAASSRHFRQVERAIGIIGLVVNSLAFTLNETSSSLSDDERWYHRMTNVASLVISTGLVVDGTIPRPIERLATLWETDPGRVRWTAQVQPFSLRFGPIQGGAAGSLMLTF